MNPWSNHQFGQAQHREYEARYGHSYNGQRAQNEENKPFSEHKRALALSGVSLAALVFALARLL